MLNKYRQSILLVIMTCLSTVSMAGVPVGEQVLLQADFNDRVPGSFLGEGGASQGEPTDLSFLTGEIIEDTPGENFLLVTNDTGNTTGRSLRWEFLNDAEIAAGVVTFSFQFTPSALDRYSIGVREFGGSSRTFMSLTFSDNGTIFGSDAAGVIPLVNNTYAAGVTQNVIMVFDMDAGTSDVNINGDVIVAAREHGITDRGVGRLLTGYSSSHAASSFNLDNILVTTPSPLPLVLDVDLEDKVLGDSIGTGGAEANEPVTITNGLNTEIIEFGAANQALLMQNSTSGSARTIRWEFLNNAEAKEGIVAIEIDVYFDQLDNYQFQVRQASGSSSSFSNTRFLVNGNISITDSGGSAGIVGSYVADQLYRLRFTFDIDNGTYIVWLDNDILVENKPYGVDDGNGIGSLLTGFQSSASSSASFVIDDLQIGVSEPTFDLIFRDNFE